MKTHLFRSSSGRSILDGLWRTRLPIAVLILALRTTLVAADTTALPPQPLSISSDSIVVAIDGNRRTLQRGDRVGNWTFMGTTRAADGEPRAVFEDFSSMDGKIVLIDAAGRSVELPKSLEPTFADPQTLYRGHTLEEVGNSPHDLLGSEILARPGDPRYADVAACFAPITKLDTYTFVGTRDNPDKIGVAYGGRTANFDPAVYVPSIAECRAQGKVLDGLVGGWLPVLRFVYPEKNGDWSELVMFAPERTENGNRNFQPVWYRVAHIAGGQLKWAKYFDSYHPFPPRTDSSSPQAFYDDLLALHDNWQKRQTPGMQVDLPDERLANQARHSLARAMNTRVGSFPKYGVLDRNYGGAEHDGFQDTFNVDTTAMLEWGLFDRARDYIDNYFNHFVRDDGSILYRGPEIGQYGRMLTVVAQYYRYTGDAKLLLKHRKRIDAVTRLPLALRHDAKQLPPDKPAYGMISGWCEADSCLGTNPSRYMQPYLSNSSEAIRGFADLGAAWELLGNREGQRDLQTWGNQLKNESQDLNADLQTAIKRTLLSDTKPACLPVIAGALEPFDVAAARDPLDPQFRAYRANVELLYSGRLTPEQVTTIIDYRQARGEILLGVPTAYAPTSHELAGFLSYGHAYGLLQNDRIEEFLLELFSLSAHQYTRGTWTAPETRRIDPKLAAAPYCVPAQLTVPLLLRWLLAYEDPNSDTLWLAKAVPREWLRQGSHLAATNIPTRWGPVSLRIDSNLDQGRIEVALELPPTAPQSTKLRLRTPDNRPIQSVELNGKPYDDFDVADEAITLPPSATGKLQLTVSYE